MLGLVATIALFILIVWLGYLASTARKTGKEIREVLKPHIIMYGLSCVSGVCAFAFFLSMDIYKPFKIMVSIVLGLILIFIASLTQRREKQPNRLDEKG